MRYQGRVEAGAGLGDTLLRLDLGRCVVAGIPRGGVLVASPVATRLGAPLAPIHTRKLSSPADPELAFGAMDEEGHSLVDSRITFGLGLGPTQIRRLEGELARELSRRRGMYPGPSLRELCRGRTVVLVDDGLATGLTMHVAVSYVQRHGAKAIVVAVPCASSAAAHDIRNALRPGDQFVCPLVDADFRAVGDYYVEFPQASDAEVADILGQAVRRDHRMRVA